MNKQSGFTLIELIMVVILLAIVATFASMRFPSQSALQASGFSDVFIQDLQLTAALAISGNQPYRLVITGGTSYQILNQALTPIIFPETGTTTMTIPTGVTITQAGGVTAIIFDSMGKPYNQAGTALSAITNFSVNSGTSATTVSVTPETGYVL